MAARKINWIAIRTAYVVKGWSAQKCADEFEVNPTTIRVKASKEGWTAERNRNTTDATAAVVEDMRAVVAADLDAHRRVTDRMVTVSELALNEIEQLFRLIPSAFDKATVGKDPLAVYLARSKVLRSLVETGAKLEEWAAGSITTGRLVRGMKVGESSEAADAERDKTLRLLIVEPPEAEETA